MNQHFTILLSVTESYRRIIIHYFLENYSEEAIDFIDAITTDIAANSISSAEQNIIVLCDSDLSISRFQNTGYPVIACSHENNTEEKALSTLSDTLEEYEIEKPFVCCAKQNEVTRVCDDKDIMCR